MFRNRQKFSVTRPPVRAASQTEFRHPRGSSLHVRAAPNTYVPGRVNRVTRSVNRVNLEKSSLARNCAGCETPAKRACTGSTCCIAYLTCSAASRAAMSSRSPGRSIKERPAKTLHNRVVDGCDWGQDSKPSEPKRLASSISILPRSDRLYFLPSADLFLADAGTASVSQMLDGFLGFPDIRVPDPGTVLSAFPDRLVLITQFEHWGVADTAAIAVDGDQPERHETAARPL